MTVLPEMPKPISLITNIVLLICCLMAFSLLVGLDTENHRLVFPQTISNLPERSQALHHAPMERILQAELFGATNPQLPHPLDKLPVTPLRLTLRGIFMAEDPADRRALISDNGVDRHYSLGERLPGQAQIKAIDVDRVIIKRAGKLEVLPLSRTTMPIPHQQNPGSATRKPDAVISGFREQFKRDPTVLAELVTAHPITLDNGKSGWRLNPGRNDSIFRKLRLQPGDLLVSINNISAENGMDRIALLTELATAPNLDLQILREDKLVSYYYLINN